MFVYMLHAILGTRIVWTKIVEFPYYPSEEDLRCYALLESQIYKYVWEEL